MEQNRKTVLLLRTERNGTERNVMERYKKRERERNDLAEGSGSRMERNDFKKVGTCPSPIPGPQSAWNTQDDHISVSTLTPSWWWFRYRANCRHCLHLAPQCSRDQHYHAFQRQNNRSMYTIKARYLSLTLKPSCEQTCCEDWWSAPPTWSSTKLMFFNSFLC